MHIPEELLAAYVDGELEGAERARVEQAIAEDARLARRVAQQRARRARLRGASDGALPGPAPQRLTQSARPAALPARAQIIDLARVRTERARRGAVHRSPVSRRIAITASLVAGLLAGGLIGQFSTGSALTELHDGTLLARGALAHALDEQFAGGPAAGGAVRVGLTFRAKSGQYCRIFAIDGRRALAGLACREPAHWRVLMLLAAEPASVDVQHLRTGNAGLPPMLLQAVNERTSGEPLDARAESRARAGGWH